MLFCNSEGLPITQYLPEGHEGREIYGLVMDPHPDKGRAFNRLEASQGRRIEKSRKREDDSDGVDLEP
jgi:ferredoxin-thioredoxin reductase catalytic chain